jgi:glutathione S-transferase
LELEKRADPSKPSGQRRLDLAWRWLLFQAAHVTPACVPIFRATHLRVQELWQTQGDAQAAEAAGKELARWLERVLARPAWRQAAELVFGS